MKFVLNLACHEEKSEEQVCEEVAHMLRDAANQLEFRKVTTGPEANVRLGALVLGTNGENWIGIGRFER
jgi:hypothetical protein